ncbi:hypothetical protein BDY19DRAFT_998651 [Irpex rosettiformis]|uniref:Uncharacterized protein n=1 Tax=Irpex rosettiformis TaxID=378272 RepID=A0ACB8TMW7_9APHY|nr:hypothetical protein BDY19DRAFT_998651 [Irpex rosettiformis]
MAQAVASGGAPPLPLSHATTLARAQIRARQFIIDRMVRPQPEDDALMEEVLLEKGNMVLKLMKALDNVRCKSVCWPANGGLMYEMTMEKGAKWVSAIENRTNFIHHYGGEPDMKISGQSFQVLVDFTPVHLDPNDSAALEWVEINNNMKEGSILEARWIKPVAYREEKQRTALLVLYLKMVEEANRALKHRLTICGKLLQPRKNIAELW